MTRFRILIQRVDIEAGQPEQVTDLDLIEVAAPDAQLLHKDTALDQLEAQTLAQGHAVMRHLLKRQWESVDQQLVANYQELFSPQAVEGGRPRPDQGGQPDRHPAPAPSGARRQERRPRDPGQ